MSTTFMTFNLLRIAQYYNKMYMKRGLIMKLSKVRGRIIEDSFKDLSHSLNEKQMEARFGKYGWTN